MKVNLSKLPILIPRCKRCADWGYILINNKKMIKCPKCNMRKFLVPS